MSCTASELTLADAIMALDIARSSGDAYEIAMKMSMVEAILAAAPSKGAAGGAGCAAASAAVPTRARKNILVAYDFSGSTGGARDYHRITQEIMADLHRAHPDADVRILLWDSHHEVCDERRLAQINARLDGRGGTDPTQIARFILSTRFTGNLVIITDGQVDATSVAYCDTLLRDHGAFASVTAHLIGDQHSVNLSVTAPFTRGAPHTVYTYYHHQGYARNTSIDVSAAGLASLTAIGTIHTIADFESTYPVLRDAIIAKTMGTAGNSHLHEQLVALKKRLVADDARGASKRGAVEALTLALAAGDVPAATHASRRIYADYYGMASAASWSSQMDQLIGMCAGSLRSQFNAESARLVRAAAAAAAPAAAVPLTEEAAVPAATFPCPISLEDEHDTLLLLLQDGTPVLAGLDAALRESILNNPLTVLNHPDIIARILAWIDRPIGLKSYQEGRFTISPLTRAPVNGGLCLSPSEPACKATTWSLARILTGGRLAGNQDLWFAVLWQIVAATEHLRALEPLFRAQMQYRLFNHTTFLSLGGRPEYVTTRGSLAAAVWFVCNAGALLQLPAARDPLRAHLSCLDHFRPLLDLGSLPYPDEARCHTLRTQVLDGMLRMVKKSHTDWLHFQQRILALTQLSIRIPPTTVLDGEQMPAWIPVSAPATPEQVLAVLAEVPERWRHLPVGDILRLASLVTPGKSLNDLDVHGDPLPITQLPMEFRTRDRVSVTYCPATCRPLSKSPAGISWEDSATETYGAAPWFSTDEHFGAFVQKHGRFPTVDEFLVYLYNRKIVHGTHKVLPVKVLQYATSVIADHAAAALFALGPAMYTRRRTASVHRPARDAMEIA